MRAGLEPLHGDDNPWPDEEVLADMRDAWDALRDELLADPKHAHSRPFFAELLFDEGLSPHEALLRAGQAYDRLEE